uniref:OSJNBa0085C10.16 protein n=1 Tax=Oryza sativa subsp. japonica TaxID=39947 RepID=Q7XWH8_ORYSJ|nr:OSJNBa0085C10.16 [Oryza sativa Japonica Group]
MGRTGSASIGDRGRRSSGGFPAKRGGGRGPPRPSGAEGGNGAGRRRPKRRRDAAGVSGKRRREVTRWGGISVVVWGKRSGGRGAARRGEADGTHGAARWWLGRREKAAGELRRAAAARLGEGRAGEGAGSSGKLGKWERRPRGSFLLARGGGIMAAEGGIDRQRSSEWAPATWAKWGGSAPEPAGGGEVLDADEEATPASFGRGGGDAGDEGSVTEPREVVATSAGAWETRQWRPEAEQWRQRHSCRRGRTSKGLRAKRRQAGGEEAAATPGKAAARPDGAWVRR